LIREVLSLVWTEQIVQQVNSAESSTELGYDALLQKLANRVTNSIIRKARPRRTRRTSDGDTVVERREVGLSVDVATTSPDPLEELLAREGAESDQRAWEEVLELIPLLPPRQREIAQLRLVEHLSHPQVASRLKLTEGGAKSGWSKAKKNLLSLYLRRHENSGDVA
jgi:RNA polymerase sigma factor (sigma-70 family)